MLFKNLNSPRKRYLVGDSRVSLMKRIKIEKTKGELKAKTLGLLLFRK
jgi:hypothetical protein